MIQKSTEFFRSLPAKVCSDCGNRVLEQHESYENVCSECLLKADEGAVPFQFFVLDWYPIIR